MAGSTIKRPNIGNTGWTSNGTKTFTLGTGAYLIVFWRPNRLPVEVFFARTSSQGGYIDSIASANSPSGSWDSVSFSIDGVLSLNVKDTYCNVDWVKIG